MKTIIIYAGKYGCTQECALKLKNKLDADAMVVDAAKEKVPSLEGYDKIIIGSSIYVGQVHKKIKAFVNDYISTLLKKKIGVFLVCGFIEKYDEMLEQNFPEALIKHAQSVQCFGGELNADKMNFLHKGVMKMLEKEVDVSKIKMMPENIEKMAMEMR